MFWKNMLKKEWKALGKQPETARCSFVTISNRLSFFLLFRPILPNISATHTLQSKNTTLPPFFWHSGNYRLHTAAFFTPTLTCCSKEAILRHVDWQFVKKKFCLLVNKFNSLKTIKKLTNKLRFIQNFIYYVHIWTTTSKFWNKLPTLKYNKNPTQKHCWKIFTIFTSTNQSPKK